ncbi:hypothetical protein F4804DRAFT_351528 [Jackrogersella minutella]|nr:hypothetical protein F4804DRAFT_351528 [Jackrogersella minutella]
MDAFVFNPILLIKQCPDPSKGIGLFSLNKLSKGLRLLIEVPMLTHESKEEAVANIQFDFHSLPLAHQALYTRLFAGPTDVIPLMNVQPVRDLGSTDLTRLKTIMECNGMEGQGLGCVLLFFGSLLNHSCVPNAWIYWNDTTGSMTLHALREIDTGEEITISYIQDSSDQRRDEMARLRGELSAYYQRESSGQDDIYDAMAKLRRIAQLMENENLIGLELSLIYVEQAQLFDKLHDERGRRDKLRKAVQIRLLCLGADHPSSIDLALKLSS